MDKIANMRAEEINKIAMGQKAYDEEQNIRLRELETLGETYETEIAEREEKIQQLENILNTVVKANEGEKKLKEEALQYKERLEKCVGELTDSKRTIGNLNTLVEELKTLNKQMILELNPNQGQSQIDLEEEENQTEGEETRPRWPMNDERIEDRQPMPRAGSNNIDRSRLGQAPGNSTEGGSEVSEIEETQDQQKQETEEKYRSRMYYGSGRMPDTQPNRQEEARTECRYYREGRCKKGRECKFAHRSEEPSGRTEGRRPVGQVGRREKIICRDYARGDCKWGQWCKYKHQGANLMPRLEMKQEDDRSQVCWYYQQREPCPYSRKGTWPCRYRCYPRNQRGIHTRGERQNIPLNRPSNNSLERLSSDIDFLGREINKIVLGLNTNQRGNEGRYQQRSVTPRYRPSQRNHSGFLNRY